MPRYVRQYDDFSYGPVAIMNAIKWSGRRCVVREDLARLRRATNCKSSDGTGHLDFDGALRKFLPGVLVRKKPCPPIRQIEEHLRSGGAVIVQYCYVEEKTGDKCVHVSLFIGVSASGKSFVGVNDKLHKTVIRRRRSLFLKYFRVKYPWVWFLKKVGS